MILALILSASISQPLLSSHLKNSPDFAILAPASFHEWEAKSFDAGDVWMGVFETSEGFQMRTTELAVEAVADPYLDRDGETTAKLVYAPDAVIEPGWDWSGDRARWEVEGADRVLFFLRPAGSIFSEGTLNPVVVESGSILPDTVISLDDSGTYLYSTTKGLYISDGSISQHLSRVYPDSTGGNVWIVWAGDLDGDGMIDIILDDQPHYAFNFYYRLYLSSQASQGQLVREVARFVAVGC